MQWFGVLEPEKNFRFGKESRGPVVIGRIFMEMRNKAAVNSSINLLRASCRFIG